MSLPHPSKSVLEAATSSSSTAHVCINICHVPIKARKVNALRAGLVVHFPKYEHCRQPNTVGGEFEMVTMVPKDKLTGHKPLGDRASIGGHHFQLRNVGFSTRQQLCPESSEEAWLYFDTQKNEHCGQLNPQLSSPKHGWHAATAIAERGNTIRIAFHGPSQRSRGLPRLSQQAKWQPHPP